MRITAKMALCAAAAGFLATTSDAATEDQIHGTRVQSWAVGDTSHVPTATTRYAKQTLREILHLSLGGNQVRIRIANTFGASPLAVGAAHVALSAGDASASVTPGSDRALTFGGRGSTTIPPGASVLSDPADLSVKPDADIAVSLYLPSPTPGDTTTFLQGSSYVAPGDATGSVALAEAKPVSEWPFVSGVSVQTAPGGYAVVAITDSATLISQWPKALGTRLNSLHAGPVGVVSVALAGNRLLSNSAGPGGPEPQWGDSVLTRFDRDVLGQAAAKVVIVWIGLNDLAGPGGIFPASETASVEDVASGLRQLVGRAHEHGLKIIGCTISPMGGNTRLKGFDTPQHEAQRVALNQWIRTSGVFDGVIDADRVLRDPNQPTRLLPAYDTGDHLHPNKAGGAAVAKAIDVKLLLGQ